MRGEAEIYYVGVMVNLTSSIEIQNMESDLMGIFVTRNGLKSCLGIKKISQSYGILYPCVN